MAYTHRKDKPRRLIQGSTSFESDESSISAYSAEITNALRRAITQLSYQERLPARLAVVSALREEGVTYTALALAAILANDLDVRVCAVELNWWTPGMQAAVAEPQEEPRRRWPFRWRRPKVVPSVEQDNSVEVAGLGGILSGALSLDTALLPTSLPNLWLLPAGRIAAKHRPIVARSAELRGLIQYLSRRYDHIILDVPAILATSDSVALASLADACFLVVRQGVTPVNMVRQALDNISHLDIKGVVLNRTRTRTPRWIYGFLPQE